MSEQIVVLGAGGTVGVACVEALLRQGASVIAIGRHLSLLRSRFAHLDSSRLSFAEIDFLAEVPWPEEVCACRRFVQCAGPSCHLTDKVIALLLTQCVSPGVLIEPGGDAATIARWHSRFEAAGWFGLFGTGIQPGLVGVVIRTLSSRFTHTDALQVGTFTGGLQPLTPAGLKEYLQAINDRTGHPGLQLHRNKWRRVVDVPQIPDCFPVTADIHPFVDEEAALAANTLNLLSLSGFNITDSADICHLLNEMMVSGSVPDTASVQIADAMIGRTPWFCLCAEGREETRPEHVVRTFLTCDDSYRVTGEVAAWTVMSIINRLSPGAGWFSAHPQALAIWSQWERTPPEGVQIVWQSLDNSTVCEEGEI